MYDPQHKNVFRFSYLINEAIASATVSGYTTPNEVLRLYQELVKYANSKGTRLLLSDFSAATLNFDTATIANLVSQVSEITQGFKVARIVGRQNSRQQVVEDIAEKQAIPIRNFTDRQTAKRWLLENDEFSQE